MFPGDMTHSLAYLLTYLKDGLKMPDSCCCNSNVHCSTGPQQNIDDDYCACPLKAVGGGGIHILGAPHFFWTGAPLGVNPALTKCPRSKMYHFLDMRSSVYC